MSVIGVIVLLCFIAPYIHILLPKTSTVKVFGFRNLRSFMYAIGVPLSLFACATLFLFSLNYLEGNKQLKKYLQAIAFLFCYNAFFQFIWIFWATTDLSKPTYYTSIAFLSFFLLLIYFFLYKNYNSTTLYLKNTISVLFDFIVISTPKKYISKEDQKNYVEDYLELTHTISKNEKEPHN